MGGDAVTKGLKLMNKVLIAFLSLSIIFPATLVEAGKGISSLLKLGRGAIATNGIKRYNSDTLNVEQLRSCMILEQTIDSSESKLSSKQSPIETQEQKLKKLDHEMSTLKAYLDGNQNAEFSSQQQVDEFNLKVERYNQFISDYNRMLESYKALTSNYNSMLDHHNKLEDNFNIICAGKSYYEDDLVTAKAGLDT